jgi:preprotein translocase subunit YajC
MTSLSTLHLLALAATPAGDPPWWLNLLPIVGMVAVFYFLMIRPQMRQQKAQRDKLGALKKGDSVVTAGGLIGKVIKLDDKIVELELAPNVKVRAVRTTIGDVLAPGANAPAND